MRTVITFTSAILVGFMLASPSQSADDPPESRTVQFADLDLSKVEGAATLFMRIRGAARAVCQKYSSRELIRQQRYIDCVELAVSNAVARVDEPALTDYVASRSASGQKAAAKIASRR